MLHFAIIVGILRHISQGVVNQPLLIGVIGIGRWPLLILKSTRKAKYIERQHCNMWMQNVCNKWVIQFHSICHGHIVVGFSSIEEMSDVCLNSICYLDDKE